MARAYIGNRVSCPVAMPRPCWRSRAVGMTWLEVSVTGSWWWCDGGGGGGGDGVVVDGAGRLEPAASGVCARACDGHPLSAYDERVW